MKLTVAERISLAGLLPNQASYLVLQRIDVCKKSLQLTDEELKQLDVKEIAGDKEGEIKVSWNDPNYEKEIEIPETVMDILYKTLKELDGKNQLHADFMTLYKKIVIDTESK